MNFRRDGGERSQVYIPYGVFPPKILVANSVYKCSSINKSNSRAYCSESSTKSENNLEEPSYVEI